MKGGGRKILVWDVPTRLFHWLVVILVPTEYLTWRFDRMEWHVQAGYALLGLVFFRILWGFFGSGTARFARFLAAPRHVLDHLRSAFRREPDRQAGHNPAGGWMVLLLLGLLLLETLSGLYVDNDVADEGPLTELVPAPVANFIDALHAALWQAILAAVALHLLAILVYGVAKGQNLVLPMITGRKVLPAEVPQPAIAGPARALALLGLGALAATLLIDYL